MKRGTSYLPLLFTLLACDADKVIAPPDPADRMVGSAVAATLVAACPVADPADEDARTACAEALAADKHLASVMRNPILWGGQKPGTSYHPEESNMNYFNTLVFREMYLSLMMFTGEVRIEQTDDGLTVVHMGVRFRNALQIGAYPYPFWHAQNKWTSYQLAREILIVVRAGKWLGAMRSADQDPSRPQVAHAWSGEWRWVENGVEMPYVSLYSYLLSPRNPHAVRLDAAYRALSDALRAKSCMMCHAPNNPAGITPLEFFNYPAQALTARNSVIARLQRNDMPPTTNDLGLPVGIADEDERQELVALAQEFKAAGDAALAFEGEPEIDVAEDPIVAGTMPAPPTGR